MDRISKFALLIIMTLLFGSAATKTTFAQPTESVSFSYFYDRLSPYGQWIELEDGLLVWKPNQVRYGWSPYSYGSWLSTRYGWYWDSTEPFGDIVYHYGRWFNDDYYGWIWIPDYDWAPAWVDWRYDDNYIGWAPLPPYAKFSVNSGLVFSTAYPVSPLHWNVVPYRRFCEPSVVNFFINERIKARVFDRMTERAVYGYENNIVINRGIEREIIEHRSRTTVRERDIVFRDAAELNGRPSRTIGARIEIGLPGANIKVREVKDMNFTHGTRNTTLDISRVTVGERRATLENSGREPVRNGKPAVTERNDNGRKPTNMEHYPGVAPERKVIKRDRKPERADKKETDKKQERQAAPERDRKNERDGANRLDKRTPATPEKLAMSIQRNGRNAGKDEHGRRNF